MKRKRFAALLAALALCVTGCARAESAPVPGPQPSPEPSPSPAASPAVEAAGELTFHNELAGRARCRPAVGEPGPGVVPLFQHPARRGPDPFRAHCHRRSAGRQRAVPFRRIKHTQKPHPGRIGAAFVL